MTDFLQIGSVSRVIDTLREVRTFLTPHCVPCMGLIGFNLSEVVKKQSSTK